MRGTESLGCEINGELAFCGGRVGGRGEVGSVGRWEEEGREEEGGWAGETVLQT